ncbi:MAG: amidohydrolase family protein [Nocardioidaceae bacterium]
MTSGTAAAADAEVPSYVDLPLVDHHCHGVLLRDVSRSEFEGLLNEASGRSPLGTTLFDSMLGLAVRRWCSPVLDLAPLSSAHDYLQRRGVLGFDEVNRRLVGAAGVTDFLVDTGFEPGLVCAPGELARVGSAKAHQVVRLETLAQDLLASGCRASDLGERFRQRLGEVDAVAAKSIAAYRVGLALPSVAPTADELVSALQQLHAGTDGRYRIAHPVVNGWLAWAAIEAGLPLQFHVGYGDGDLDLAECDPLRLTGFLRATEGHGVPVLLLHNYPFHRNAAYLAQVFDHAFMDVGLAVHNTGALSAGVLREALEIVPFGKLLFSSDGFGLPELHYLGALLFRKGLSAVLDSLIVAGDLADADARRVAALVGAANARRVYGLGGDGVAGQ